MHKKRKTLDLLQDIIKKIVTCSGFFSDKCTSPAVDSRSFEKSEKLANSDMILNSFLRKTVSISVERATPVRQLSFNICSERVERVARDGIRGLSRRAPAGETLFVWSVLDRSFWLAGIVSFPIVVSHEKERSNWLKRPKLCNVDAITGVPPTDDNPILARKLTQSLVSRDKSSVDASRLFNVFFFIYAARAYVLHMLPRDCNGGKLNAAKCMRRVSYYIRP